MHYALSIANALNSECEDQIRQYKRKASVTNGNENKPDKALNSVVCCFNRKVILGYKYLLGRVRQKMFSIGSVIFRIFPVVNLQLSMTYA
jgi:hypothetical protein